MSRPVNFNLALTCPLHLQILNQTCFKTCIVLKKKTQKPCFGVLFKLHDLLLNTLNPSCGYCVSYFTSKHANILYESSYMRAKLINFSLCVTNVAWQFLAHIVKVTIIVNWVWKEIPCKNMTPIILWSIHPDWFLQV